LVSSERHPPFSAHQLSHIGEPTEPPAVLPARAPPQVELDFDQVGTITEWPDMDQTAGAEDGTWN